ncbi:MAG: DUF4266 domain-containing protein [Polyangia bacterium]
MTRFTRSVFRSFLLVGFGGLLVSASGCTRVRPYQRGVLAHPTMLLTSPAGAAESHVYAIQEGASGGGSGAEGGCGCN